MVYSVVIPVYNCGEYIVDAINSALAQTIPAKDIIVIDDGSIDDTAMKLSTFKDDKRIVCLRQNNKGVSSSRNKAIEYSSSDLIAFLDADDRWHPQKMEKQLSLFADNVGLVYSLRQCFDDDGFVDSIDKFHLRSDNVAELLLEINFICTSSAVVLRKSILDVGLFKGNLSQGEDRDLWLRIAAAGYGFDFVKETLVYYRMGGAASNLNNIDKRFCDNKLSMTELFAEDSRRQIFSSTVRRRAWAALWRKYAYAVYEKGQSFRALKYSFMSLLFSPLNEMCVKIFFKSIIPRRFVSIFREAFHSISSVLASHKPR